LEIEKKNLLDRGPWTEIAGPMEQDARGPERRARISAPVGVYLNGRTDCSETKKVALTIIEMIRLGGLGHLG